MRIVEEFFVELFPWDGTLRIGNPKRIPCDKSQGIYNSRPQYLLHIRYSVSHVVVSVAAASLELGGTG